MKRIFAFTCMLVFLYANAQVLSTDHTTYTPQQLVNNILKGTGVTISNITYTGASEQIGSFTNGASFGIQSGIMLTSGHIQVAEGPNNADDASFVAGWGGDSLLEQYVGVPGSSYDAAILEFDMVSTGNEVFLKYVFGSEEYPEYVCSAFNDAFAFFITGPGYSPNTNVALIPSTSVPVMINSINGGSVGIFGATGGCTSLNNTNLYINNTGGTAVQYDGYTVPLTARMSVVPNATYHIRLTIADILDEVLDSGIFFEAGSLTSGGSITVPLSVTMCSGDSLFVAGAWQTVPGIYRDTLAAAGGMDSIVVTTLSFINLFATTNNVTFCQGDSFFAGGSWRYSSGVYADTFISSGGCDSIVTHNITVSATLHTAVNLSLCGGDSVFAAGAWQTAAGVYYDTLPASGNCDSVIITTIIIDTDLVWPGDANDDFIANNTDLLYIGLSYGSAGFARDSLSYIWQAHCAENWNTTQANGANTKHADCNGDGVVSATDTLALNIHYGLTHTKGGSPSGAGAAIKLVPHQSIYYPGDTALFDLVLGDNTTPVNDLHGIAFTLNYDNSKIETNSVRFTYNDSWLGDVADNLTLTKIFESNGELDGALTRVDRQNASGTGAIGALQFITNSSINSLQTTTVNVTSYTAVNASGSEVLFDAQETTFTIDGTSGVNDLANELSSLSTYPNPFNTTATIEYTLKKDAAVSFRIYDILGKIVFEQTDEQRATGKHQLQFEQAAASGSFIVELTVNGKKIRRHLIQIH